MIARVEPASGRVTKRLHVGSSPSALGRRRLPVGHRRRVSGEPPRRPAASPSPAFCRASAWTPGPRVVYAQGWEALTLVYDGLLGYPRLPGAAGEALVGALASVGSRADRRRPDLRLHAAPRHPLLDRAAGARRGRPRVDRARGACGREALPGFFANIVGAAACAEAEAPCDLSRGIVTDERARTVTFRLRRPEPVFPYKLAR